MPLILVPTPLGHLQDITLRALAVLRQATLIVAEDTRVTRKLLSAHEILAHEIATYNEYTSPAGVDAILARASSEVVVLVSDAGMPGVCDPGSVLVQQARERSIAVEVLPGPTAFIAAAVLSGFPLLGMSFEGFVPRGAGAKWTAIEAVLARQATSVWYETPHRVSETLGVLAEFAPTLPVFLLREYTKRFEQQVLGSAEQVLAALPQPVRGEFVLVLDGRSFQRATLSVDEVDQQIDQLLADGRPPTIIAKRLAKLGLGSRNELYRRACERGKPDSDAENALACRRKPPL